MRLLFLILLALLVVGILVFLTGNPTTTVPLTLWTTRYEAVHVGYVVILSIVVGVIFASIFALVEGARTRIENRRLRREIARLGTEINFLRSQPKSGTRSDRPTEATQPDRKASTDEIRTPEKPIAAAPIYESGARDDEEWPTDPDDDAYSGGRAV